MRDAEIRHLKELVGQPVRIRGWLYNARSSGKLRFLVVRDGSGYLQAVVFRPGVEERVWEETGRVTQESSLWVTGTVKAGSVDRGRGRGLPARLLELRDLLLQQPLGIPIGPGVTPSREKTQPA